MFRPGSRSVSVADKAFVRKAEHVRMTRPFDGMMGTHSVRYKWMLNRIGSRTTNGNALRR